MVYHPTNRITCVCVCVAKDGARRNALPPPSRQSLVVSLEALKGLRPSVSVVAGGAHASLVGEHCPIDSLARLDHAPVVYSAHAGPAASSM